MEERRSARIGTVSGLALLAGATALVAVAGGKQTIFATLLLGLLAAVMSHALVVEIQRQTRRRVRSWGRHDTVNPVLLACWALCASALVTVSSRPVQILGVALAVGYVASSAYYVVERRRTIAGLVLAGPVAPAAAEEPAAPARPVLAAPGRPAPAASARPAPAAPARRAPAVPARLAPAVPARPAAAAGPAAPSVPDSASSV